MIRRNLGVVLTATAVLGLLLVAFILSLAQDKLPELALELIVIYSQLRSRCSSSSGYSLGEKNADGSRQRTGSI